MFGQVAGILSKSECSKLIAAAEAHGFSRQQSRGPKFGEVSILKTQILTTNQVAWFQVLHLWQAPRDNGRIAAESAAFAATLWQAGLSNIFKDLVLGTRQATGLNSQIRLYR